MKGSQGVGVMICKDQEQTNTMLESFWGHDIDIMLQRFIDAERKDVTAIVVGDKVVVAMQRTGAKDFRASISQGGSGRKVNLTTEQELMCVQSAKVLGLEFAGVDLMTDRDGKSYIIEVNGNPGTKIIDITDHNYFIDLVRHIEMKVKKSSSTHTTDGNKSDSSKQAHLYPIGYNLHTKTEYQLLKEKEANGTISYNESAKLAFFKSHPHL